MRILVLKHVDCEGLGVWEEFCRGEGIAVDVAQLHRGDPLPPPGRYHGVVSLGGPMNVYQEEIYPFLKMEDQFIREALAGGVPFLGICLGGQLLAKAVGGIVMLNAAKEIGWHRVTLNEMGVRDPLFAGLPESFTVFQWHSDAFRPPVQAVPLASSPVCQDQAFRLRGFSYALQFHLEMTPPMIKSGLAHTSWPSRTIPQSQRGCWRKPRPDVKGSVPCPGKYSTIFSVCSDSVQPLASDKLQKSLEQKMRVRGRRKSPIPT